MTAIYDRSTYGREKQEALTMRGDRVEMIVRRKLTHGQGSEITADRAPAAGSPTARYHRPRTALLVEQRRTS